MTPTSRNPDPKPSHFSCTEVARRLGLSRQRFWQLRKEGVFPKPLVEEESGRPYYSSDQLEVCLDLRRRNVGVNGQVVLFYSARPSSGVQKAATPKQKQRDAAPKHQGVIDSLKALGLVGVNDEQVEAAVKEAFPTGKPTDLGETVRAVFLVLQRKN